MELHYAILKKRLEDVRRMLADPDTDPNAGFENNHGTTPLMMACVDGNTEVVRLFLDNPRLTNHNQRDDDGWSALHYGCSYQRNETVAMLIQDSRVDIAAVTQTGKNCFHVALSCYCKEDPGVARVLLASERPEIPGLLNARDFNGLSVVYAVDLKKPLIMKLINDYNQDSVGMRGQLRIELGWPEYTAAELFATIVLLCDDYYEIKE